MYRNVKYKYNLDSSVKVGACVTSSLAGKEKSIKECHLIRIIWDSRVENPVFPIINEVMTPTGPIDLSS